MRLVNGELQSFVQVEHLRCLRAVLMVKVRDWVCDIKASLARTPLHVQRPLVRNLPDVPLGGYREAYLPDAASAAPAAVLDEERRVVRM